MTELYVPHHRELVELAKEAIAKTKGRSPTIGVRVNYPTRLLLAGIAKELDVRLATLASAILTQFANKELVRKETNG